MPRMTISLSNEMHQALKETAARQHRSIGSIIEESLRFGVSAQEPMPRN